MLTATLDKALAQIQPLSETAMTEMANKLNGLLKPPGSLGRLEQLAVQLAGISDKLELCYDNKAVLVFAADHGVFQEGVAITPQSVTMIQAANMVAGLTGVCAIAKSVGAKVVVTDVGINCEPLDGVNNCKIRPGCDNIAQGPAMSREEALRALDIGIQTARDHIERGADIIGIGELGIANTTPAAAMVSVLCGASVNDVVGLGANLPQQKLSHKVNVVKTALAVNRPDPQDAIDVLAKVGGFELAAMSGAILGAAADRTPIVLDGFLSYAAALVACRLSATAKSYLIPSHLSAEKGAAIALAELALVPYLNMEMRLGEGSGAALAFPIIDAACSMVNRMGSLADSNIVLPD
jgi:nicotinate-nucleotide--dimethylbenzimidazole phosphoribosyltransferase